MTAATIHRYFEWQYQFRIDITNPSSTEGFQGCLSLTWQRGMNPDFSDIRFFSERGVYLPYWIETYTASTSATVWIALPANATAIWMLFGNPFAEDASDGDATFHLFDHFDGTALNSSKWEVLQNNGISVSDGALHISSGATNYGALASLAQIQSDILIQFRIQTRTYVTSLGVGNTDFSGVGSSIGLVYYTDYESAIYTGPIYGGNRWIPPRTCTISSSDGDVITAPPAGYFVEEFAIPEGGYLKQRRNGGAWTTSTRYTGVSGSHPIHIIHYRRYAGMDLDYILVRKYAATEPTLAAGITEPNPYYYYYYYSDIPPTALLVFDAYDVVETTSVAFNAEYVLAVTVKVSPPSIDLVAEQALDLASPNIGVPLDLVAEQAIVVAPPYLKVPVAMAVDHDLTMAPVRQYWSLNAYDWIEATVEKSVTDPVGTLQITFDGTDRPPLFSCLQLELPDHNGVDRCVFLGTIPNYTLSLGPAKNRVAVTGYEYGFYLASQMLPFGDLVYPPILGWTPMGILKYWLGEETLSPYDTGRWWQVTGIMPYRIDNPTTWGHDYVSKTWRFQPQATKSDGVRDLCSYCDMVWLIKPYASVEGARYTPAGYFVHRLDIDHATHGLDLPAKVTFTAPDPYVVDIRANVRDGERINRVIVRGFTDEGAWHEHIVESDGVAGGTELPIEYLEESEDYDTGEKCVARAEAVYAQLAAAANTYTAELILRTDLELFQLVAFSGYTDIPTDDMRIIGIRYRASAADTRVTITCTTDTALNDVALLARSTEPNFVTESATIAQTEIKTTVEIPEVGNIATVNGRAGSVDLESGATVDVRFIGTIEPQVGAQVLVISTRSGLIAITGTEGETWSGSGGVNPPVDFDASRISDTEVYLTWTPGAGNDYVRIMRKASGYPISPTDGTIVGNFPPGTTTYMNSASSSTIYYYRAWGMQNGIYSDEYLSDIVGEVTNSDPIMICDAWSRAVQYFGEEVSYGPFAYIWDGEGSVYISASPTAVQKVRPDDGMIISTSDGTIDTGNLWKIHGDFVEITSILAVGLNYIHVSICDLADVLIGSQTALYIMRTV